MRCSYQDQRGVEEYGSCPGRRLQLLSVLCLLERLIVKCAVLERLVAKCAVLERLVAKCAVLERIRVRFVVSEMGWYCYSVIMDSLLNKINWDVIIMILPYCNPLSVLTQMGYSFHSYSHVGALNRYYRSTILGYDRLWKDQCIRVVFVRSVRCLDWISREAVQRSIVVKQLSLLYSPCVVSENVFFSPYILRRLLNPKYVKRCCNWKE